MPVPDLNHRSAFHFDLPAELIAQRPLASRSASRLLHLGESLADREFAQLPDLLRPNDLLVFNDTRVIPARVYGVKPSGGKVEIVLERVLEGRRILAQVGTSKPLRAEVPVLLPGGVEARLAGRQDDMFLLDLTADATAYFQQHGAMPLPPYIAREAEQSDNERYQTVFSRELGAVAAPTAGLHFDADILKRCAARGVQTAYLTLHVGAGTYQPLRVADLRKHQMHSEFARVPESVCRQVAAARERGGRIVAVGTTVVRSLESAAANGTLEPFAGETRIFIRPGYGFKVVDALLTNFHLPESTLLMLVCAFGGYERAMDAYRHAVEQRYRFFSYGDAMLIEPKVTSD
jgi:S-adenosylmethionine:tRNA ribosyltransferase-isomerase